MMGEYLTIASLTGCFIALLAAVNYRVGQILNPPLKAELEALQKDNETVKAELADIRNRISQVSIDKGFR